MNEPPGAVMADARPLMTTDIARARLVRRAWQLRYQATHMGAEAAGYAPLLGPDRWTTRRPGHEPPPHVAALAWGLLLDAEAIDWLLAHLPATP